MTTKAGGTHQIELADVRPGQSFRLETSPVPLSRFSFECRIAASGSGSRISQRGVAPGERAAGVGARNRAHLDFALERRRPRPSAHASR